MTDLRVPCPTFPLVAAVAALAMPTALLFGPDIADPVSYLALGVFAASVLFDYSRYRRPA